MNEDGGPLEALKHMLIFLAFFALVCCGFGLIPWIIIHLTDTGNGFLITK